jgi:hypothetical protein
MQQQALSVQQGFRLLTTPFVVFIKLTGTPKADFPVSPYS